MNTNHLSEKNISIYAVLISIVSIVVSVGFSLRQCSFENKLHRLHIDPSFEYYMVRSRDNKSMEFYAKNNSPIPIISLSVDHKFYLYSLELNKYVMKSGSALSIFENNWIFKKRIEQNIVVGKKEYQMLSQLKAHKPKTMIIAAVFQISYYRESDMKHFNDKAVFFLDGDRIFSYKSAFEQDIFINPIEQLPKFEKRFGLNKMKATGSGSRHFQKADTK